MSEWRPDSWKNRPVIQVPEYPDQKFFEANFPDLEAIVVHLLNCHGEWTAIFACVTSLPMLRYWYKCNHKEET